MRKLIVAMSLWPAAVLAGGYAIPNENARDLALSQAAVAAQNGPEAVVMNPAALAGQEGLAISGSIEMLDNRTTWSDPSLGTATTDFQPNFPPALNAAYGGRLRNGMAWGVGAGFLVPGGGSLYWPANWAGAGRIQRVDQLAGLFRAGGALEPLPGVKVAATFGYWRVTEKLSQYILDSKATLGLAGGAPTFGLSAELRAPWFPLTIGVDYRNQAKLTLKGKAHFDNVPPALQTQLQDQGVSEDVTVPMELFIGAAYQVSPQVQLMGSYSLEGWHVYKDDTYRGDKGLVVPVQRNYKDAYVIRLGAEVQKLDPVPALTLRGGILRSISEQPTDTISPTLSDANSWAVSAGFGYEVARGLRLDAAYQYAWFDTVTATGIEAFPGTYKTYAHLVSVGFSWRPQ